MREETASGHPCTNPSEQPYVSLDVETTGTDPSTDSVVEIAALLFHRGIVLKRFATLVGPPRDVPPEASAVNHITADDLVGAPEYDAVQEQLDAFVDRFPVVAHNAPFDSSFVPVLRDRLWVCSYRAARHLWPDAKMHKLQYLRYWLPLDKAALKGVDSHRAEGDAMVAGLLMHRELRLHESSSIDNFDEFVDLVRGPVTVKTFPYGRKHNGWPIADIPLAYLTWVLKDAAGSKKERRLEVDPDTLSAIKLRLKGRSRCAA